MFNRLYKVNLNCLKINNVNFETMGLYLKKGYVFNLPPLKKNIEDVQIPGRIKGSVTKVKGYLNREFTINFDLQEVNDLYSKLFSIEDRLVTGRIITINNEKVGYKLIRYEFNNINIEPNNNKVEIKFICEPFLYNINGSMIEGR